MDIHVDMQTVITAAAFVGALITFFALIKKGFNWFSKPEKLEVEIKTLREKHENDMMESNEERQLMCFTLFACLDGLEQLGCNHTVTEAKNAMEKHLNKKAHEYRKEETS